MLLQTAMLLAASKCCGIISKSTNAINFEKNFII